MAVAAPPRPPVADRDRAGCAGHAGGRRLTLEQRLERACEGLRTGAAVDCPLCGATMTPAGAEGRCGDCGSTLS